MELPGAICVEIRGQEEDEIDDDAGANAGAKQQKCINSELEGRNGIYQFNLALKSWVKGSFRSW